ncbi:UNVERIFIED_CONTAM: hypothetical protein Sradi_1941600 [Sesamum radiatum]|uniref:C2 domain-containing protein n=1 Tax=Sesamum radiatum TaxID=300843 RepID=A0AAW2TFT8_SESRA
MAKLRVEVCLISARRLRRTSSLWRLQWFAVGWINTNDKYCTTVDASGSTNPVWKTKFSMSIDASDSAFQDLELHVEVYSREPVFLRERLLGTATVVLKELLDKYYGKSEVSGHVEEVGSFQLRKKNSDKPRGFVDLSIRISEESEENGATYPATRKQPAFINPPNYSDQASLGGPNYHTPGGGGVGVGGGRPIYHRTRTPPPPLPPSNVGYVPTFFPRTDNLTRSIAAPTGHRPGPGFATGLGAEALAAGAMIFGDDFLSWLEFSGHSPL